MTSPQQRPLSGAVAAAVARVLDVNPALLRWDTPLSDLGADDVALVLIADVLIDAGHVSAAAIAADLPRVTTFGELVTVASNAADAGATAATAAAASGGASAAAGTQSASGSAGQSATAKASRTR